LLVPHVPRTVEENSQFKTEMRRKINVVDNEAWKRMVLGMIGAVNYGSGKKAYRPSNGRRKNGTCIGQGSGWAYSLLMLRWSIRVWQS